MSDSLRDKREQGNYRKATEEYIALLLEVVEKAPSEFGYEFGILDSPKIVNLSTGTDWN